MSRFYVVRKGNDFKIAETDPQGALRLHEQGWELGDRISETREEAEKFRDAWIANFRMLKGQV